MKTIVYVGNFKILEQNAPGKRVYANSLLLRDMGYKVICLGMEGTDDDYIKTETELAENVYGYRIAYLNGLRRMNFLGLYRKFTDFMEFVAKSNDVEVVIIYETLANAMWNRLVIKWCKQKRIKVITDSVDWLKIKTNNFLFDLYKNIDTYYLIKHIQPMSDAIIAITDTMKSKYNNNKVVVIPPLSTEQGSKQIEVNKHFTMVYAGQPFRIGIKNQIPETFKDRVDIMFDIAYEIYCRNTDFVFKIYGFTKEEFLYSLPENLKNKYESIFIKMSANIEFYGKTENAKVKNNIKKADISILWRDVKRDTMVGFPTKVSEAVSCGTPVVTNDTSDIKKYIVNGKNGFICGREDVAETICSLIENRDRIMEMKKYCSDNNIFHYKNFIEEMKTLVERK